MINIKKNLFIFFVLLSVFITKDAHAKNIVDDVIDQFKAAGMNWQKTTSSAANWLFWTLATISMVWTMGLMALRKADISEFFTEFFKFIMFTGIFWWFLNNVSEIMPSIINSLPMLAMKSSGMNIENSTLAPIEMGFNILGKALGNFSIFNLLMGGISILVALAILIILALVTINYIILLCSIWVLAYSGIFFLGFGGSRWTSDIATNYYKTILCSSAQLMALIFVISVGIHVLETAVTVFGHTLDVAGMAMFLVMSVIFYLLSEKVPPMVSSLVSGAHFHGPNIMPGKGAIDAAVTQGAKAAATGTTKLAAKGAMTAATTAATGGVAGAVALASGAARVGQAIKNRMTGGAGGGNNAGSSSGSGASPFSSASGISSNNND